MKIRTRINFTFISVFAATVLILGWLLGYLSTEELKKQSFNEILNINTLKAEHIKTFLGSEKEVVLMLGASTVFRDFLRLEENSSGYMIEKERSRQRLVRSKESVEQIYEIFIIDKDGKISISTDKSSEGLDKSKDLYFIEGKNSVYVKSLYYSETVNKLTYAASAPIKDDATGNVLGVVVARFDPTTLFKITEGNTALGKTGENFLVNRDRYLLSQSVFLGKDAILKSKIETENTAECFSLGEAEAIKKGGAVGTHIGHDAVNDYTDYRGVRIIGTHAYIPEADWCLVTKIDQAEVLMPSYYILFIFIIVCLIALIIFLPIGFFISKRIAKPIYELQQGVEIIEKGDLNYKVSTESKDEVGLLSQSFNKMVESIKKSRAEIDLRVNEQTKEIKEKRQSLEDQQKATLNILEDVEDEKEKIAQSEARNSALLEGIGDGVIAVDNNEKIIFINKNGAKMLGYDEKFIIGKDAYDILKIKDEKGKLLAKEDRPLYQAIKNGKTIFSTIQNGYTYERKDKINFAVAIVASPVIINGLNVGAIDVFRNITDEMQIDKAKNEFVSLASHQLRTPLSAINWYAEMILAGDAGKVGKEQKEYIEEIYRSNQRMIELVNALLNVSRIDLGTFAIEPKLLDINEVAESVIKQLEQKIKEKEIKFTRKFDSTIPKINIDPNLTEIIFQNLLTNAVKYTQKKGNVCLSIEKQKDDILISVKDNGYGIPKEAKDKIFGKLYRADNIRVKETDGNGLGLYILKSIVEQSGGKIWFESAEKKGTTFYVTIPLSGMKKKEGTKGLDKTA